VAFRHRAAVADYVEFMGEDLGGQRRDSSVSVLGTPPCKYIRVQP
jgi:hypothetical protein